MRRLAVSRGGAFDFPFNSAFGFGFGFGVVVSRGPFISVLLSALW
jgi:hypothetical protein